MNENIIGTTIKKLRIKRKITQAQLAEKINVSRKTVSKWETCKGSPDISIIEKLAVELGVSVAELMSGDCVINHNVSGNIMRSKFYVCPICGNIIHSMGETFISCCGISLTSLDVQENNEDHVISIEKVEDESFISIKHSMTKEHYISFIAYLTSDKMQFVKLYPEGNGETRLNLYSRGYIYIYCTRHGLMRMKI